MKRFIVRLALTVALATQAFGPIAAGPLLAQSDLAAIPPLGRMIPVNGRQVHLYCTGTGAPTVILEAGLGHAAINWAWVQRDVAKTSRVCSYDRPGYGWSEPTDLPLDATNVSRELYALLQAANEKTPYIAVGHSLGGAYARMFAAEHRKDVAGLVLVDASNPSVLTTNAEVGLPAVDKGSSVGAFLASSDILWKTATGLGLINAARAIDWNDYPPDVAPAMRAFLLGLQRVRAFAKERGSLADTLVQIRSLDSLGNLPVTVIASDKWVDADAEKAAQRAEWNKRQQRNWLSISTNSRFLIVPGADHLSLVSNKDHAAAVAKEIVKMVERTRHR